MVAFHVRQSAEIQKKKCECVLYLWTRVGKGFKREDKIYVKILSDITFAFNYSKLIERA